jgi:hypothetical protein
VGTTADISRAANSGTDEFVIVNAATPATPTRAGGYGLNVIMNDVYINGTTAYIATGSDTQEVLVLNIATPAAITLGTSINLSGTADATSISGSGTAMVVSQGAILYTVTATSALAPTQSGSVTLPGTIADVSYDATHKYAHVGTSFATGEFQVVDASNAVAPAILSSVDVTGTTTIPGVAYNASKDVTPAASSVTTREVVIFAPN